MPLLCKTLFPSPVFLSQADKAFYYTPPGSNDDWYWLYATVRVAGDG